jgi:hypothetical protein
MSSITPFYCRGINPIISRRATVRWPATKKGHEDASLPEAWTFVAFFCLYSFRGDLAANHLFYSVLWQVTGFAAINPTKYGQLQMASAII